jgi:pyruvate kinase
VDIPRATAEKQRTKMVCTLGPSSNGPEAIRRLMLEGMDVARLNFSHGTHDAHRKVYDVIRATAEETGCNVAVLADLQGPKIRTGKLENGVPVEMVEGNEVSITAGDGVGCARHLTTSYEYLAKDVKPGDRLLISDGAIEFKVERVEAPVVHCRVARGGRLKENQGINLPGVAVSAPSLTEKDIEDLGFALEIGVDFLALSFVRRAEDVIDLKNRIRAAGKNTSVVAKIERPEALDDFDRILDEADAIMVARGDLGVEADLESVPQIQKEIILRCNERARPVITATQMLESMIVNSRPTRAEVGDVANAIYDGTDAVMLSGETAAGQHPIEAARWMAKIAATSDLHIMSSPQFNHRLSRPMQSDDPDAFARAIGDAAHGIAHLLDIKRVVCFTRSGRTAAAIARFRPHVPITAITSRVETQRRCALIWGVEAIIAEETVGPEEMCGVVDRILLEEGVAQVGDPIIIVAGMPSAVEGKTNLLKLHRIGDQ